MKLKEVRIEKKKQQKELALSIGTDVPMISKFENYKCLPIPEMLIKICEVLDCKVADIYDENEIYIKKSVSTKKQELTSYKVTVCLPREAKEFLQKSLKKCGYKDITYWIYRCYERLKKQYEIIMTAEKKDLINADKQIDEVFSVKGNK